MEKDRKLKVVMLSAIIIAVIGLTVAFAALSSVLNITGSSTMDKAGWDIHFKNVQYVGKSSTATVSGTPSPSSNNTAITISGLSVTLKQPGDYVTYSADIENSGDIDAEIAVVTPPTLTSAQQTIFDFDVVYTGTNNHPAQSDELPHTSPNNVKHITMTFKYKDSVTASQLPSQAQTINLTYSIHYVQSFSAATTQSQSQSIVTNNCTSFETKSTYSVGDTIALCNTSTGKSEDFYVISDNGSTVTALAQYNLLVGDRLVIIDAENEEFPITALTNSDPEYGIQSSKTLVDVENFIITGIMAFSETNYWDPNDELDYSNDNYPFIFNSNSNLWTPVQNYQTYLRNTLGKTSVTATLMSKAQAEALKTANGGDLPTRPYEMSAYWLGSAQHNDSVWSVSFEGDIGGVSYDFVGYNGVRPVITISKSEIN